MKAVKRLNELEMFSMTHSDVSQSSIEKIKSTVRYSLSVDPSGELSRVVSRCRIAQMAEQKVAEHMNGQFMDCIVDLYDPYTYAFDVLSGIEYGGLRVEVKTHQKNAEWITVNLDSHKKTQGLNLFHFMNYNVADYIAIYQSTKSMDRVDFKKLFVGTREDVKRVIKKSNYSDSWYLNI